MTLAELVTPRREDLLRKVEESHRVSKAFFEDNAERIAMIALEMARRFRHGGRLFTMGNGGSACDAEHVAVEFMHPIFEKRKPLPAICLSANTAALTAISNDNDYSRIFIEQIKLLGKPEDIALAFSTSGMSANIVAAIKEARDMGMLTVGVSGKDGGRMSAVVEHELCVSSYSIHRIQEAHVMLLHTLWDLVHLAMGETDVV